MISETLLGRDDPHPVGIRNGELVSEFIITCEHAGNAVPKSLNGLGLGSAELNRHIAVDIGILAVSERVSDLIRAPLVYQRYSRLVAECNRVLTDTELFAVVSDGTVIPGNEDISEVDGRRRIEEIIMPYQNEITCRLDEQQMSDHQTLFVSMHSFTPSLRSRPSERPWHVGLCIGVDDRFTNHVAAALRVDGDIVVGFNEPYTVDMAREYTIPVHAEGRSLPYVQFEIRQDLIADESGQKEWAIRVANAMDCARATFLSQMSQRAST
ncbi:N-formylglutamate amidohydrolase [Phyllobacterium sophorae]|uniref:N-formylglutamate amidohydrolase n=1 Tax=Phyllobacterium sophorae TaxID=1520277 RepID=UPI001FDF92FE|nr:N-formylglutamate amidohydrolase [Phyllobacterium sophorae]